MSLILIGFQRVGKTYFGKLLAEQTQRNFIDGDDLIVKEYTQNTGQSRKIYEIHKHLGEKAFRALEEKVILNCSCRNSILALGGGAILCPNIIRHCQTLGKIVYLSASYDRTFLRLKTGRIPTYLSKANLKESFEKLYFKREPMYQKYADYEIDTTYLNAQDVLSALAALLSKK